MMLVMNPLAHPNGIEKRFLLVEKDRGAFILLLQFDTKEEAEADKKEIVKNRQVNVGATRTQKDAASFYIIDTEE